MAILDLPTDTSLDNPSPRGVAGGAPSFRAAPEIIASAPTCACPLLHHPVVCVP